MLLDLYGKSHVYVQFGEAGTPMQTVRAELRSTAKGDPGSSIFRVRVPGYGWRKLRHPVGRGLPYVILKGDERATVTV